jgi:Glycosyl transferases group 1
VFLNSSISEGLPLALGEAALTGAPIVCTDVGASLRVLKDPDDGSLYSEVVAPNDAYAMARAQIKLLALLEEWDEYADVAASSEATADASFPAMPTPEDVTRITQRMYEQSNARRALGMKSRAIIQKSFSGERYLREHEQMLWVGKARNDMARAMSSRPTTLLPAPRPVQLVDVTSARVPEQAESGMSGIGIHEESMQIPSLTYRMSTSPSMATDLSPPPARFQIAQQREIKIPQQGGVKIVNVGHSRVDSVISGSGQNWV